MKNKLEWYTMPTKKVAGSPSVSSLKIVNISSRTDTITPMVTKKKLLRILTRNRSPIDTQTLRISYQA